jgi:hypothetical protein
MHIVSYIHKQPHTWNSLDSWKTTEKNYGLMYIVGTFMAFCFMKSDPYSYPQEVPAFSILAKLEMKISK